MEKKEEKSDGDGMERDEKKEEKSDANAMQHDEKKEEKSDGDGMECDEKKEEKSDGDGMEHDEKKEEKSDGDGMEHDEKKEEKSDANGMQHDEKKSDANVNEGEAPEGTVSAEKSSSSSESSSNSCYSTAQPDSFEALSSDKDSDDKKSDKDSDKNDIILLVDDDDRGNSFLKPDPDVGKEPYAKLKFKWDEPGYNPMRVYDDDYDDDDYEEEEAPLRRSTHLDKKARFSGSTRRLWKEILSTKKALLENNGLFGKGISITQGKGRGRGGRGRGRGWRGRGRGKPLEPHDWNDRDWRTQCGSVKGIADSCPINYKEILGDLQT